MATPYRSLSPFTPRFIEIEYHAFVPMCTIISTECSTSMIQDGIFL